MVMQKKSLTKQPKYSNMNLTDEKLNHESTSDNTRYD